MLDNNINADALNTINNFVDSLNNLQNPNVIVRYVRAELDWLILMTEDANVLILVADIQDIHNELQAVRNIIISANDQYIVNNVLNAFHQLNIQQLKNIRGMNWAN